MQAAVGQAPSLADVIKMVHPKPADASREALYAYLIGKPYDVAALPQIVRDFEQFKREMAEYDAKYKREMERVKRNKRKAKDLRRIPVPAVPAGIPFQMLTALPLTAEQWAASRPARLDGICCA